MSHAGEVLKCPDDQIVEYPMRESGYTDYRIGRKITVSYRGGDRYLCLTCVKVSDCEHATRIERYRNEHLAELNFGTVDPSILPAPTT